MNSSKLSYPLPVADLHCDMLHYLADEPNADPRNKDDIGCAIGHLQKGNVKLQVMAICSIEKKADVALGQLQHSHLKKMQTDHDNSFYYIRSISDIDNALQSNKVGVVCSIENATAISDEGESLELAFARIDSLIADDLRPVYISLTHHVANRFGGGNNEPGPITSDGKALLDFISGKGIAADLSHSSDVLANGIIDHIDSRSLKIPIIASHSNYRPVFNHVRNLPDELTLEIIKRGGLIGLNLVRAFLHPDDPDFVLRHIEHALKFGAEKNIAFGADYYCFKTNHDPARIPYYLSQHENASKYPEILASLSSILSEQQLLDMSHQNVVNYLKRNWKPVDSELS